MPEPTRRECEDCHRPMKGPGPYGPKCARKHQPAAPARARPAIRRTARATRPTGPDNPDQLQLDLEGAAV